jgi:hypothetical protein
MYQVPTYDFPHLRPGPDARILITCMISKYMCSCIAYGQECIVHTCPDTRYALDVATLCSGLDPFRNRPAKLSPTLSMFDLFQERLLRVFSAHIPHHFSSQAAFPSQKPSCKVSCLCIYAPPQRPPNLVKFDIRLWRSQVNKQNNAGNGHVHAV